MTDNFMTDNIHIQKFERLWRVVDNLRHLRSLARDDARKYFELAVSSAELDLQTAAGIVMSMMGEDFWSLRKLQAVKVFRCWNGCTLAEAARHYDSMTQKNKVSDDDLVGLPVDKAD